MIEDQLEEAVHEFERALELDPAYGEALHALAMTYYHREDYDNAILVGQRLAHAEPYNALAFTSLSMFYHAKGLIEKAEEMGAKARAVSSVDAPEGES